MNKVRTFFYMSKQGLQNIAKNGFMIFASVSVIFVSLFILGAMLLLSYNIESILQELSAGPAVVVNCDTNLSQTDTDTLYKTLQVDSRVKSVSMISKEENFENMKNYFEEEEDLFSDYTTEDMFVSFEVELKDIATGSGFVEDASRMVGVKSVRDTVKVLQFFTTLKKWVSIGTVIAVVGLGILSYLLTGNTIKLTVVARKTELEIMKYVGATNSYIRGPFVIEGLFIGLLGATLSYFLLKLVYGFIANYVNSASAVNNMIKFVDFSSFGGTLLLYFMLAAVLIGILGSLTAIRKHLKV